MFWFLVAPSFQQCASSGMCWRSYIQGFHLFHTKTDIHRHWRCQFPFLSFLQPPILHAWLGPTFQPEVCDEWKCVSSCPMPIFSRRLSDTTWCSTAPAEPKKNGARMWSKDKMGGSPITVHLQNKSYQFIQRWLINIYLFAVVKKYSCSFFNSIFSIGVIQFCIYIYMYLYHSFYFPPVDSVDPKVLAFYIVTPAWNLRLDEDSGGFRFGPAWRKLPWKKQLTIYMSTSRCRTHLHVKVNETHNRRLKTES